MGWQVFRGPCFSEGLRVLAWPTRCPLWSLPALSGTLILRWQGQTGTFLDGKAGTALHAGQGRSNLKLASAGSELRAVHVCGGEKGLVKEVPCVSKCLGCLPFSILCLLSSCCPLHPVSSCVLCPLITSSLIPSSSHVPHSPRDEGRGGKRRYFCCC